MFSWLSNFILKLFGWKIIGEFPDVPKFIIIALPHTSNWDFPIGILTRSAKKLDTKFFAKDSLFRPPFGFIFKWMNGHPIVRDRRTNFVDSYINVYKKEKKISTMIAPEGKRTKVTELKTGFYFIAKGAEIPIVMVQFDWGNHIVRVREPFYTTDDKEADFKVIEDYYRGVAGRIPENGTFYP